MDNVVMIRTVGGEYILGTENKIEIVGSNGESNTAEQEYIELNQCRILNLQMTSRGAAIALMPICPFSKNEKCNDIKIHRNSIIVKISENDIDPQIVNSYKSNITGIDMSAANQFVM